MADEGLTQEELNVSPTSVEFTEAGESVSEAEIYTEEDPILPDDNRRKNDAMDVSMQASGVGKDPRPVFEQMMSAQDYNPDDRALMMMRNVSNTVNQEEDRIKHQLGMGFTVDAEKEAALFEDIEATSKKSMAEARTYVMSNPSAKSLSEDEREDAVFINYLKRLSATVMDEASFGTIMGDFASQVVLPQENFRVQEVAEVIGADFSGMDLLDTTDFYSRLTASLLEQEPEQRVKVIEHIVASWPEIKGNNRLALATFLSDVTGDYSEDIKHAENWIERADQSMLTLGLGKVIKGGVKSAGALRMAGKLRNTEAMADAVEAGARGELSDVGVTPLEAASSLDPSAEVNMLNKGADNSLSNEVRSIQAQNRIFLDEIDEVNNFGLALTEGEKLSSRERAINGLEKQPGISNVKAEPVGEKGFKLTYDLLDEEGRLTARATQKASYVVDDVNTFISDGKTGYTGVDLGVTSPNFRFTDDRKSLVQLPEQMQMQGAKIRSLYDQAIKSSLKGLSKKENSNVDSMLRAGDEFTDDIGRMEGKEFTFEEAVETGINGLKLTEKEFNAYKGVRQVIDHMYWAKNKEIIDDWNARGIKVAEWGGESVPVKSYATPQAAKSGFLQSEVRSHWVAIDGEDAVKKTLQFKAPTDLTDDIIEEMYADGFQLTRITGDRFLANGSDNVEWAFIRGEGLKTPSGMVLNRREGYMPKIRTDAHYFVKERVPVSVGGTTHDTLKTVRYFDNNLDAQKYLDEIDPDRETYQVLADRELSASARADEYVGISGGLFTGARKSAEIPFGLPGDIGKRVDALGSLQRYVNNISRNMPMNLYRTGMQQRWINHAKDLGALPGNYVGSFSKAINEISKDADSFKFLSDSHGQISFVSGIPTEAERAMAGRMRSFSKGLEKFPVFGKPIARRLNDTSAEGMAGTARGLTFHMMLGMYNPAQFAIQASGSLVALAINPIHGARAIGQGLGAAIADTVVATPNKLKAFKRHLSKKGLLDEEAYDAWNRSGMREAVTHSNLDYHSLWNDAPYDAGVMRKVLGNGDVFFRHGELVNSRISFFTAFNRWRELNPGKAIDDSAISDIVGRAEQYRLNMSKMNSAKFQTGLKSVPTQFQQVNTKFFEKLFGKDFNKAEKARLLGTQAAVFGAAGVPLVSSLAPHVLEMAGIDATNTSSETLQTLYNGVAGWLIQDYFDINSVITGRMTLGQDFIENLVGSTVEPMVLTELALGPFNEVFARSNTIYERMTTTFSTLASGEDMKAEDFAGVSRILVKSLAQFPSSTANAIKAWDMTHSKFYKNKKGKSIFEWADNNTQTIVAQALGFSPQEVADWYELHNREGGMIPGSVRNAEASRIAWLLGEMANQSEESSKRWHAAAVNSIISKYDQPQDRLKIMEQIKRLLKEPVNAKNKQIKKALEDFHSEAQSGLQEIHTHSKIKSSPGLAREIEKAGAK